MNSSTDLPRDFREFIECLNGHGVTCVLVGGYALGWHGVVRATGDIDFLYKRSGANVERLCAALEEFGAPAHLIDAEFMASANAVTQFGTPPLRIDLMASITGVTFKEAFAGSIKTKIAGLTLRILGLDELRANKAATGRAKDRADLRRLDAESKSAGASTSGTKRGSRKTKKPKSRRRRSEQ